MIKGQDQGHGHGHGHGHRQDQGKATASVINQEGVNDGPGNRQILNTGHFIGDQVIGSKAGQKKNFGQSQFRQAQEHPLKPNLSFTSTYFTNSACFGMALNDEGKSGVLRIGIIGGSISGLLSGLVLKNMGHDVHIFEREADEREPHMAGVCLGPDAENLLAAHDRIETAFSHTMESGRLVDKEGKPTITVPGRRQMTNWLTLYLRLRANFDGYRSAHYPNPPQKVPGDGAAVFESDTHVVNIARDSVTSKMVVHLRHKDGRNASSVEVDLVVGADGPNSTVRNQYLPQCQRRDAGYVAWRGTVPELEVSEKIRQLFGKDVTVSMNKQHHNVMYMIPGNDGSLEDGKRFLNLLWYTNESPESMEVIMTDSIDGHVHRNTVPKNHLQPEVWKNRRQMAEDAPLSKPFLEVIRQVSAPFVQRITDHCATQAVFEDGKVVVVGDALCLYRPHTAFSTNQAAFHALCLGDYVRGKLDHIRLNTKLTNFSRLHWVQSRFWGDLYQRGKLVALITGAQYLFYCVVDRTIAWWSREEPLLRTPMSKAKEKQK